jgi:DNA-binding beta-propeller fold protein YncE
MMLVSTRRMPPTLALLLALAVATPAVAGFVTFESGQVRPLALSADGSRLFAVNTPDNRLEIFDVTAAGLTHRGAVPVGMEPVAVAVRSASEVWVVNNLSDSVSVVDVGTDPPRVVRTLLVGDEPHDIVFAGPGRSRAFITTAHRGQQRTDPSLASVPGAGDPQLTTPGVGRADVWVFDANALGTAFGGVPLRIVTLFGDTPRALAVSPDGGTVYAAIFKSGNQTTVIPEAAVCNGFTAAAPCVVDGVTLPGGLPGPGTDHSSVRAPETGLIVRLDPATGTWKDQLGRDWSPAVQFDLPDEDVFAIDASTLVTGTTYSGVGTTLFNMSVNPVSGKIYVSNMEARNEVRFEGPGIFGGSTVQGHLAEARITVLSGSSVAPRHLNKHIDYSQTPAPPGVKEHSLSTPVGMAVSPDGGTLYVAAFGSAKIGVFDTAALENDTFDPISGSADYIPLSGGGPSGLVLDAPRDRLYVLTRFDDTVSVVDLATHDETQRVALYNPEPPDVVEGRPFLYDAVNTSSNGEASCASCHIFGDMDDLGWDLGNPDDDVKANPIPINLAIAITGNVIHLPTPINGTGKVNDFHPMKGPMTTQTLRGLLGSGAMHWRGDRSSPPGTAASAFDEVNSFNNFNSAFVALVGRDSQIDPTDMQKFTNFGLQIKLPPNPVRALDNSLTDSQARGQAFFLGPRLSDGTEGTFFNQPTGFTCEGCHRLEPDLGHFGTDGRASFENEEQTVKIPHLRNLYQKVGMFGDLDVAGETPLNLGFQGPQVRGFGYLHDGSVDTIFRFLNATVFRNDQIGGPNVGFQTDQQRRDVEQYLLAFDSNLAPIVGQQITLDATSGADVTSRIDLLEARAVLGECDVVVKGIKSGEARGWVRLASGTFVSDRVSEPALSEAQMRAIATTAGQDLTFSCVPPGSGNRIGIDRDEDGFLDRDELDDGKDPADPASFPGSAPMLVSTKSLTLKDGTPPSKRKISFQATTKDMMVHIGPPLPGSIGDPTLSGAALTVYNSAGLTNDVVVVDLPAGGWSRVGGATPKGYRFKGVAGGAIKSVVVKADGITVKGGKDAWTYTLNEPKQQSVAVRLRLGSTDGWCTDAPALAKKGDPSATAKSDRTNLFKAEHKAPAPAACPDLPSSTSPSGAFLD